MAGSGMTSFGSAAGNVLYLVVCAAPPAKEAPGLVRRMQEVGWDVCVVTTPMAEPWVDAAALTEVSGHPVRSRYRRPDDPAFEPLGDAVLVAPATFNTVNQVAVGINDSLALGLINEALGRRYPVVFVPCVGEALAAHPAYDAGIEQLTAYGAHFLFPTDDDLTGVVDAADRILRKHGPPETDRPGGPATDPT
jgi:phosphopantothenoylcysteine synthetase/decarboxylase